MSGLCCSGAVWLGSVRVISTADFGLTGTAFVIGCPMSDLAGGSLPEWMRRSSGYACTSPVRYPFQGEMYTRSCGRCRNCLSRNKRDVAGRAAAEAFTAAEVVCFTLTYGRDEQGNHLPGAADFVLKDRQNFLKRLRAWLHDEARRSVGGPKRGASGHAAHVRAYWKHRISEVLPKVRFVGCGERGKNGSRRCHWHVIIFGSRPMGLTSTAKGPDGHYVREKHPLWKAGFCTVDVLPVEDMGHKMRAVRYCVKYLTKARAVPLRERRMGVPVEAKFFRSTHTPLGYQFLTGFARKVARAGLPMHGKYTIAGVTKTRGRGRTLRGVPFGSWEEAPDLTQHTVLGRMRDHFIAAYNSEWEAVWPDRPVPATDWMRRFDDEWSDLAAEPVAVPQRAVVRSGSVQAVGSAKSSPVVSAPVAPVAATGASQPRILLVRGSGGRALGTVEVDASGTADFAAADGSGLSDQPVRRGGLRDVPGLSAAQHREVERWIAAARGPGWRDPCEVRSAEREVWAARQDAIRRFALDSPNIEPRLDLPPCQEMTGLRRKLRLNGDGYIPGTVVQDADGSVSVRGVPRLLRSIHKRPA